MSLSLVHPWALALLLLVPAWLLWLRRGAHGLAFARTGALRRASGRRGAWLGGVPEAARALSFALLAVALAGPRTGAAEVERDAEGIAIMVALDVSSSMLAEDFQPRNRLGAAKRTVAQFIRGREHDRIGLVSFAGEALTRVPLTVDYTVLAEALDALRVGDLEDGTAIGDGIAAAANRLRQAAGQSRVIVLMSDGVNNRGDVDPRAAAGAAAALGIRIYTIGVGSDTRARIPVAVTPTGLRYVVMPVQIDERLLTDVAASTGGRYFRAKDTRALQRVYAEIDRLERTPVRVRRYVMYADWYLPFLLAGAALLLLEWFFRATRWGRVP
ncbi:MAG TPA: VWA domain-containing protein [Longimicrobium sp.]|nr:VWA domain-containing protein [Longimicrobium sp.]